jgi:hypothetical protein
MYSVTRLLDVVETDRDRMLNGLRIAAAETGALRWVVQPTLPGSRNGGDILVHLRFADEKLWDCAAKIFAVSMADAAVIRINGAGYSGDPRRCGGTAGTVYRALLLRVQPGIDTRTVARFEHELASMPRYVPAIRAWQLSRVSEAVGTTAWTHVFEQEFSDVAGLMGPYLMHPIHWAVVDRWFDPECPDVIIRDRLCHSFCHFDGALLTGGETRSR